MKRHLAGFVLLGACAGSGSGSQPRTTTTKPPEASAPSPPTVAASAPRWSTHREDGYRFDHPADQAPHFAVNRKSVSAFEPADRVLLVSSSDQTWTFRFSRIPLTARPSDEVLHGWFTREVTGLLYFGGPRIGDKSLPRPQEDRQARAVQRWINDAERDERLTTALGGETQCFRFVTDGAPPPAAGFAPGIYHHVVCGSVHPHYAFMLSASYVPQGESDARRLLGSLKLGTK
jgi:hypothetical protein